MDPDFQPGQPQNPQVPSQPVMDVAHPAQVITPGQDIAPQSQPQVNTFAAQPLSPSPDVQQPTPQPMQTPAPDAQEVGVPNYEQQHVSLNKQVGKKRRGLMVVIILAIVITLGLIGAAGYMYWQSRNESAAPVETTTTETTTTDDGVVDETDIDETTTEIDNTMNSLDDSADFGTSDLSDDGIGL